MEIIVLSNCERLIEGNERSFVINIRRQTSNRHLEKNLSSYRSLKFLKIFEFNVGR